MLRSDIRIALAAAVAAPYASYAIVLNQDGLPVGRLPVAEAVCDGVCFFVQVRQDMLVADFDRPDDAPPAEQLCTFLRQEGLLPVLVASGQPGHRHVFCKVPEDRWDAARRLAKVLRADVRASIRPPLTPHRQGLVVHLLSPTDPMEAVWWLRGEQRDQVFVDVSEPHPPNVGLRGIGPISLRSKKAKDDPARGVSGGRCLRHARRCRTSMKFFPCPRECLGVVPGTRGHSRRRHLGLVLGQ